VEIKCFIDASVICGDNEGLAFDDETDVADETLIENGVHGFAIVFAAVGQALHSGAWRGAEWLTHARRLG